MKNLLLVTSQTPFDPPEGTSEVELRLPGGDIEANLLSLFTSLYPGRLLPLGRNAARERSHLRILAERGFHIYADAPERFAYLLPAGIGIRSPAETSKEPWAAWIHLEKESGKIPPHPLGELQKNVRKAFAFLPEAFGEGDAAPRWGKVFLSFETGKAKTISVLDLFPLLAGTGENDLPAGDGSPSGGRVEDQGRVFFCEEWREGIFSIARGNKEVTAAFTPGRTPSFLRRLIMLFRVRQDPPGTLWDAAGELEAPRGRKLSTTYRSENLSSREEVELLSLLENHLAAYDRRRDEQVLERLRDLGYL